MMSSAFWRVVFSVKALFSMCYSIYACLLCAGMCVTHFPSLLCNQLHFVVLLVCILHYNGNRDSIT